MADTTDRPTERGPPTHASWQQMQISCCTRSSDVCTTHYLDLCAVEYLVPLGACSPLVFVMLSLAAVEMFRGWFVQFFISVCLGMIRFR